MGIVPKLGISVPGIVLQRREKIESNDHSVENLESHPRLS